MMLNNSTRQSHHLLIATLVALIFIFMLSLSVSIRSKAADEFAAPPFNDICQSDIVRQLVGQWRNGAPYGDVTKSSWSPDGQTLLILGFRNYDRQLFLWDSERTDYREWFYVQGLPQLITWSPDSQYFVTANDGGEVDLWNVTEWSPARRIMGVSEESYHVAWGPDSKQFIAVASKEMTLLDLRQPQFVQHFEVPDTLFDVAWSSDNVHFITTGRNDDIYLWDTRFRAPVRQYKGQVGDATHIQWNADGRHFLTGNNRGDVFLWDVGKKTPARQFESQDRSSPLRDIKWSPDGKQFLTLNDNGNTFLWNVDESQPIWEYPASKPNGGLQSVAWLPNGKYFVTSGRDVLLWNVERAKPIWKFLPSTGEPLSLSLNPHRKLLAITGGDGQVFVWDIDKLIRLLPSMTDINSSVNHRSCRPGSVYRSTPTPNDATKTFVVEQSTANSHIDETYLANFNAMTTGVMLTATAITFTPSLTFTAAPTIPTSTSTAIIPIIYQTATTLALTRQEEVPSSVATSTPVVLSTGETAMTLTRSIEQTGTAVVYLFVDNRTITLTPSFTATATALPPTATPTSNLATLTVLAETDEVYQAATQTSSLLTATVVTFTPTPTPT